MASRVLIVPDKFKGTLTATQAAAAIASGWRQSRPQDQLELLPMADGGDGFGPVLGELLGAERRLCNTVDAAGRPRDAEWWLQRSTRTGVIETAQVNGLALLPAGVFHPFALDTFGLGAMLRQAAEEGARHLFVGIGGSATNDGGFGLARALGWIFWGEVGNPIREWTGLDQLVHLQSPDQPLDFERVIIAVDVSNPLLGPQGASRIYGPQKGLREPDFARAEACLEKLAGVVREMTGEDVAELPGAGAAGGLGFGLKAFCGGEFQSGGEIFARLARLDERMQAADLIITAEGAMDEQTLMGKGVGVIAEAAARAGRRCLCLAGSVSDNARHAPWPNFEAHAIVPTVAPLAEAKARAAECLQRLAQRVAAAHRSGAA